PGGRELVNADEGSTLSATVSNLPIDGSTVYVRLYSKINGAWVFNDYTYTATTAPTAKAQLTTPAPSSTLTASTVQFQWTGGTRVSDIWLHVGSTAGASN